MDTTMDYKQSESVADLMPALAKAQATMDNPEMDSYNPFFQSHYPSLASVRNAVIPPLAREGIAVLQCSIEDYENRRAGCVTTFWHGNQFIASTMLLPVTKSARRGESQDARGDLTKQDYAGTINYARRMSLMTMAGVAGETDEDGNDEQQRETNTRKERSQRPKPGLMYQTKDEGQSDSIPDAKKQLGQEITTRVKEVILPLNHHGLYKAVMHHAFEATPDKMRDLPLPVLEAGMPLFRHLCDELKAHGKPEMHPDEWVAHEQRKLAAIAQGDGPREDEDAAPTGGPSWGPESPDFMTANSGL